MSSKPEDLAVQVRMGKMVFFEFFFYKWGRYIANIQKCEIMAFGLIFSSPRQSPGRAIVLPPASSLAAAALAKC